MTLSKFEMDFLKKIVPFLKNLKVKFFNKQLLVSNFREIEYGDVENVFINNTSHKDLLVQFVRSKILPQLVSKKSFLDIGAGPGEITKILTAYFDSTTVVEPNPTYRSDYKRLGFLTHIRNFQDEKLENSFDFILCSHVLYHLDRKDWAFFLNKINQSLSSGGKALVVLVAPRGSWHDLRASICSSYSCSSEAEKVLKKLNIFYRTFPVRSSFKSFRYEDFHRVVSLFTIDDCFLPKKFIELSRGEKQNIYGKIEEFISTCKKDNGVYELVCEDDFIIIDKK